MKKLISSVKNVALQSQHASCNRTFLNSTISDPNCQKITKAMMAITPE
jgi:hypothetical protein